MDRLAGKVAIVTGGASGIGEGIARLFAKNGAKVVIADIHEPAASGDSASTDTDWRCTDVSSSEDVQSVVDFAVSRFGRLDILVNNAGIIRDGAMIADALEADFDAMIAVNLKGVWLGMKHAIPAMLVTGGGSVVNVSSIAGLRGLAMQSGYGATKGGVNQLTLHVAREYASQGVRVNSLCPGGGIVTPLSFRRRPGMSREEVHAAFAKRNPSGLVGHPDDVGHAAVWLGSDESRFVTGQVIAIDGGATSAYSGA